MWLPHLSPLQQGVSPASLPGKRNFVVEVEYNPQFVLLYGFYEAAERGDSEGPFSRLLQSLSVN